MNKLTLATSAALSILAFTAPSSAETIESTYTRHDYAACDEQKSPEPETSRLMRMC